MMPVKRTVLTGLLGALLQLCLLENNLVRARSTGAPVESNPEICNTLTPGHHLPASMSDSPYSISLASESYKPGVNFTVAINMSSGSPELKGIFLQMRTAVTQEIIGSWSVMDSVNFRTVSCNETNDSAVTHQNSNVKPLTNTFTWTPPDIGGPDIYVAATFVQDYVTFWVNVTSMIIPDECKALVAGLPICNHGTCASNAAGGIQCNCEPGYTGIKCQDMEIADDPCIDSACMNGSTCVPDTDGGNYTCTCPDEFTGPMCNLDDPCSDNACMNGSTCVPDTDGENYTCSCPNGFTGPMCNLDDPCSDNACLNGSTCVPDTDGGNYTCSCPDGFTGPMCNLGDPCSDNACMNGSTCVPDTDGGNYTCSCPEGFTGPMCNLNDPCSDNACMNGSTCVPETNGGNYTCTCLDGFTGPMCNLDVEEGDAVTTPAQTTAQGSFLAYNFKLAVSAVWLAVIINSVILGM